MANRFDYIDGVTIAVARRVAAYAFGEYLIRVDKNKKIMTYDVYVMEDVDSAVVDYYKGFWGASYRVFLNHTTEATSESKEA